MPHRSTRVAAFLAGVVLATACSPDEGTRSCVIQKADAAYGLTGNWTWNAPGAGSLTICLRQFSPAQVEGTVSGREGTRGLIGGVAPSGAIFLVEQAPREAARMVIARRVADTVFVDWVGPAHAAPGRSAGTLGGGRMLRR